MDLLAISREASALESVTANVARAETPDELSKALAKVVRYRSAMIGKLTAFPDPGAGAGDREMLRSLIEDLSDSAMRLGKFTEERIRLRSERLALTEDAIKAHRRIYEMLASIIDEANFNFTMELRNYNEGGARKNALAALSEQKLPALAALFGLRAETNLIIGILTEASLASNRDRFAVLQDRLLASTGRARQALASLSGHPGNEGIGAALESLLAFAGSHSILTLRDRELAADEQSWRLVREARAKGERLANAAESAAAKSREGVSNLVLTTNAEVKTYSLALALLLASSLIVLVSAFIFIRRCITQRLGTLRSAILTIASGNLAAPVPIEGDDELADMGAAMETFKANASKLRQLEDDQFKTLAHAEQALKAKNEFLSNMSHELRTPMHAILSYAKMGFAPGQYKNAEEYEEYFKNIHKAGTRLLGLLNNLLDLAKLESGKMAFNKSPGDFSEVLEHTMIEMNPLINNKLLTVKTEITAAATKAVFDKQRMIQVMVNLISNAVKYSLYGDTISICISDASLPDGEALCCSVADNGTSIPEGELETVFDKFIQSSKTKTGAGGTGLGLAICREIVEAHGGKIWAANRKPHGVVLNFTILKNVT